MRPLGLNRENYCRAGHKLVRHDAKIAEMVRDRFSVREIAFAFACSEQAVYNRLRVLGITTARRPGPRSSLKPESHGWCRQWYEQGWGARRMAQALIRRGLECCEVDSLTRRILRWRESMGLPPRLNATGFPKGQRRTTRPVAPSVTEAKIDAALKGDAEQLQAELSRLTRRCDCGGLIGPGVRHECGRVA